MIVDTLLIVDIIHPWISTICHLYFSVVRSEKILSQWCPHYLLSRKSSISPVFVGKFDHTRIVSDTPFPILKCSKRLFFHQITDADPPKSHEIFKSFRTSGFLLNLFHTDIDMRKIVSEYDQEIPQSQTADNPLAPRGRAAQPS